MASSPIETANRPPSRGRPEVLVRGGVGTAVDAFPMYPLADAAPAKDHFLD